ncbi:unnamed protein product [Victoria cruziana]
MEPVPSGNLPPGFDPSTCRSVYVGNLHVNVTEALLAEVFQRTGPLEGCKLIKKEKSSYGFVDYHDRRSAALAIMMLHGQQLFGQPIKVNWAYASGQREDTSGHFNIFVGDLSPEVTDATLYACFSVYLSCSDARVMWDHKTGRSRGFGFVSFRNQQDAQSAINDLSELHRQFHMLGAGVIEEVRVQRDKGFGFVRYYSHEEAALAIQMANGRIVCGKSIKCSWGNKPTPPGTASNPLPPPVPPFPILNQGYSAASLLAYQRQLALSQAAGSGQPMSQASAGHGPLGGYDGYLGNGSDQQMYYQ